MNPTGTVDREGRSLVLTRSFAAPVEDVWASITESERLGRWFGTWTGDPADGFVMVTMNAEPEPGTPLRYDIDACDPPRLLRISANDDAGHWVLAVELAEDDDGTTLTFRQEEVDLSAVGDMGPGWEWYLDRLAAAVAGTEPPGLAEFETDHMALAPAYAAMSEPSTP
jgi:uncharacterized protein YndB with AHSA1/START domain